MQSKNESWDEVKSFTFMDLPATVKQFRFNTFEVFT
jgi:hypothetical protein